MCASAALSVAGAAHATGPGLPNKTYTSDQVMTVIGRIDSTTGAPRAHGNLAMHHGHLLLIFSRDSGEGDGGFAFFDVADPTQPKLVYARDDDETYDIREAHGFGFSRIEGRDYVAMQASLGVQIWDITNELAPTRSAYLKLPGITASDYGTGAWWVFWQGAYLFVGGSGNGLYVVRAADPANPELVVRSDGGPNPIPVSDLGAFKTGPVFAIGNYLAITGMDQAGYSMVDVRDPASPKLLATRKSGVDAIYSGLWNGNLLIGAGTGGLVTLHDVSKATQIADLGKTAVYGDRGGYVSFQDGFVHIGASNRYLKVDATTPSAPTVVGFASSKIPGRDEDFATAMGNLVFVGDDHGNGTSIIPHQAAPDTTAPSVTRMEPQQGAVGQPLTTRIGISFSDAIDFDSVTPATFQVSRTAGPGQTPKPVTGILSYQTNIVSFSTVDVLPSDTTFEIRLPKGGVRDVAGNALSESFVSWFSTGKTLESPGCKIAPRQPVLVGKPVAYSVELSGPACAGGCQVAWAFGDGAAGQGALTSHTFDAPGHYAVTATLRDATTNDVVSGCSLAQTVHRPLVAGRPRRSSRVALDVERNRLWVVNSDASSVSAIDLGARVREREVSVPSAPRAVSVSENGDVWVVSDRASRVTLLEASGQRLAELELPYGARPSGIVQAPDGSRVYVALRGSGKLVEIDAATRSVTRELDVGPTPEGLALSADGTTLLVSRFVSPLDHAEVRVVDTASLSLVRVEELTADLGPDTEASGRGVLNYLRSPTISPDGARAFVPAKKDNTARGLWNDLLPLSFENTVRASVAALSMNGGEETGARLDLNDRSLPSAVEFSPLGDLIFVATEGTNTVDVRDAYAGDLVTTLEKVGAGPDGLALSASGGELFVHSASSRSVSIYDVSGVIESGDNLVEKLAEVQTVAHEPFAADELLGKRVFYDAMDRRMSRDHYLSCASCHLDGEHDGRVWDFSDRGEGLRNTISLLGKRGTGQGWLHWSANFDEVQDFEHDIRNAFAGLGFMTNQDFHAGRDQSLLGPKAGVSAELDALDAYVTSLTRTHASPYRESDGTPTAAARRGAHVFERLGCDGCHRGRDFTDSAQANLKDVGTLTPGSGSRLFGELEGIDTPTLIGLFETAPYLHDGSAPDLDAVLEQAASTGLHGDVASLSTDERQDLKRFLLELDDGALIRPDPGFEVSGGCSLGGTRRRAPASFSVILALGCGILHRRSRAARRRSLDRSAA